MASGFESRWGRHHPMMDTPPPSLPPAASAAPVGCRLGRSARHYRSGCTVAAFSGGLDPPPPPPKHKPFAPDYTTTCVGNAVGDFALNVPKCSIPRGA
jgi:hypothetical protein